MLDSEAIKERINGGHYSSGVNARRAIGQLKISKREKKALHQLVDEKLPQGEKEVHVRRKKDRKRDSRGRSLNGAGDSIAVTLYRLSKHPDAFALMAHLIAKAVDENKNIYDLHEDVKSIASYL